MKTPSVFLSALFSIVLSVPSQAAISMYAAWDLNEGSGSTITQYQLGAGESWNQVSNPSASLTATASEDISTVGGSWNSASPAPNSSASLTFTNSGGGNELDTNVDGSGLAGTGAKTFVAWINPTGKDSNGSGILSYSPYNGQQPQGDGKDLRFLLNSDGKLRVEITGSGFAYTGGSSLVNDGWKMVAAVFDNTNGTSIYIGGQGFVTTQSLSFDTAGTAAHGGLLDIALGGVQVGAPDRSFVGDMDMAAVYNGAASLSELNDIYTNGIVIPEPGSLMLVGMTLGALLVFQRRR
ncbi:hypothetical protein P0Y35_12650 [Kiritimatiellaeota bacterium B1221]|nr:hypothetical protein [Kiritimatiellaeota bacterium B1221]